METYVPQWPTSSIFFSYMSVSGFSLSLSSPPLLFAIYSLSALWRVSESVFQALTCPWTVKLHISFKLKLVVAKIDNTHYLVTMTPIKGWDILISKCRVSSWSWYVGSRTNWQKQWSEQLPSIQWLLHSKNTSNNDWWTSNRATGAEVWRAKASPSGLVNAYSDWKVSEQCNSTLQFAAYTDCSAIEIAHVDSVHLQKHLWLVH